MSTVVVIPAHNEATCIAETIAAVLENADVRRALVVDDGSTDRTAEIAEASGADVLRLQRNVGKGAALNAGLDMAVKRWAPDIVALIDGDLGGSASQVRSLLAPVIAKEADMTIASFPPPPGPAGFGLVKGLARRGIRMLGGPLETTAPLSGQRAIAASALPLLLPIGMGYGAEVTLTVRALRAGLRVREVPTTMTHAHTGRDLPGFVHRGRQFAHVVVALARLVFERPRMQG